MDEVLISEIVDRNGIKQDSAFMIQTANEILQAYTKLQDTLKSIGGKNTTGADLRKAIADLNAAQAKLDQSTKALTAAKRQMLDADLKAQKVATETAKTFREQEKAEQESIKTKRLKQAEAEKAAKAQAKEEKALKDSMNTYLQLSRLYNEAALRAKNFYAELGASDPKTIAAVNAANRLGTELKKIDAAVGQFQRNVGNYTMAQGGLNASFGQIARELPAAAVSMNTFFLAISNNIPIFIDSVQAAKKEISELSAQGQKAPTIWQSLGKAIFSFNTLMAIGVTALTLFGGKIIEWVAGLFKGRDAVDNVNEKLEEFNRIVDDSKEKIAALNTQIEFLQKLSRINIDIGLVGAGDIEKLKGDLLELRQTSIQNTDKTGLLQQQYQKLFNSSREAFDLLLSSVGKLDPEMRNLFYSTSDVGNAIAKMEEAGGEGKQFENVKKLATGYKNIVQAVEETEAAIGESANNQRIIYRQIELTQRNIAQQELEEAKENAKKRKEIAEQNRKALYEITKARLEDEIKLQKSFAETATQNFAIDARRRQFEKEKELIEKENEYELAQRNLTAGQKLLIEDTTFRKLIAAEVKYAADIIAIRKRTNEQIRTEAEQAQIDLNARLAGQKQKEIDDSLTGMEAEVDRARRTADERIKAVNESYRRGEIDKETFEARKLEIENAYLKKSLQSQIAYYKNLLNIYESDTEKREEALNKIAELERQLSEVGLVSDKSADKSIENLNKIKDALVNLAGEITNTVFSLFTAALERQKIALQEQIDMVEERKRKELEANEQTLASNEQKAAAAKLIEVRAQAQREQIQRKQRDLDLQKARFDKARALADIVQQSAVAVISAQKLLPPFSTILTGIIIATAAAQAARIIAQPLPAYRHGTKDHPGGAAIVGDGGVKEYVKTPDGRVFETPDTPTVYDLPKHSIVYPNFTEASRSIPMGETDKVLKFPTKNQTDTRGAKMIVASLKTMELSMVKAIQNSPQPIIQSQSRVKSWVRGGSRLNSLNNY